MRRCPMNPDQLDLARRLAASDEFVNRAAPIHPGRSRSLDGMKVILASDAPGSAAIPDLTDDATGGVLLGMLGGGWISYRSVTRASWSVRLAGGESPEYLGTSLAEACARALLAEWGEA